MSMQVKRIIFCLFRSPFLPKIVSQHQQANFCLILRKRRGYFILVWPFSGIVPRALEVTEVTSKPILTLEKAHTSNGH